MRVLSLIAVGLILTLSCVNVRLPWTEKAGFAGDMLFFQRWAGTASELRQGGEGIGKLYKRRRDCNYPPLYLYVLSYLPGIDTWWHGQDGWRTPRIKPGDKTSAIPKARTRNHLASIAPVLKLPAMIADILITLLILTWMWGRAGPLRAVLAASLWALNPLSIYNSSFFGQIDAIHSLWMLAALLAAIGRRPVLAWPLVALAVLTKFQSIVIVPVIALLTLRPLIDAVRQGEHVERSRQIRTLLVALTAAAAVFCIVLAPFARVGALKDVKRVYTNSVSERGNHARVTVIAYNFWWWTLDVPVNTRTIPSDQTALVGPFTARDLGIASLGLLVIVACGAAYWGGGLCSAMLAAPTIALGFFLFSTQMKSRYGFASLVLMLPLISCSYRFAFPTLVMSATFLINSARVAALPAGFFGLTSIVNSSTRMAWGGHRVAIVNLALLAYLLLELFYCAWRERRGGRGRAGEISDGPTSVRAVSNQSIVRSS